MSIYLAIITVLQFALLDPAKPPEDRQLAEFLLFAMPRVKREARQQSGERTLSMKLPARDEK